MRSTLFAQATRNSRKFKFTGAILTLIFCLSMITLMAAPTKEAEAANKSTANQHLYSSNLEDSTTLQTNPDEQNPLSDKEKEDKEREEKEKEEKEKKEKEKELVHNRAKGYSLSRGEPTPQAIDRWLARFNSPIIQEAPPGKTIGQVFLEMGWKYGINPAYAVAFFTKESTCGTNGSNLASRNFGNIRWTAGYPTLDNVWRSYSSWTEGMEDWFKLLRQAYGATTLEYVLPTYAPPSENDTELYMTQVMDWVDSIMWDNGANYYTNLENRQYFPETGYYVGGRFLAYWREHGQVTTLGWPVGNQIYEDGRVVQYFERAVMEYHPENEPAQQILLRTLGREASNPLPPVSPQDPPDEGAIYFTKTGHWLSGHFAKVWTEKGGLAQFGYPLAEPVVEGNKLVQWCERIRFEIDLSAREQGVMLGLVGREAAIQKGYLPNN